MKKIALVFIVLVLTSCEEIIDLAFNPRCEVTSVSAPWIDRPGVVKASVTVKNKGSNRAINVRAHGDLWNGNECLDSASKYIGGLGIRKSETVVLEFHIDNDWYGNTENFSRVTANVSFEEEEDDEYDNDDDDDDDPWWW